MWKHFKMHENYFIFKVKSEKNNLAVIISDLKSIWKEEILSTDILLRFRDLNPSFDCNEGIIEQVYSMMDNIDKALEKDVEWKENIMILNIKSELEKNYTVVFRFALQRLSQEEFFREVTLPMVQTVLHLEKSQNELHNLIKQKDRELEEYKLEKGEISREDLKTEPYDFNSIGNVVNRNLMLKLFDNHHLPVVTSDNVKTEVDSEESVPIITAKKPLKRRIYSSKRSLKKERL